LSAEIIVVIVTHPIICHGVAKMFHVPKALTRAAMLHLVRKQNVVGRDVYLFSGSSGGKANTPRTWSQLMLYPGNKVC
jgi:hypothetical protein